MIKIIVDEDEYEYDHDNNNVSCKVSEINYFVFRKHFRHAAVGWMLGDLV